MLKTFMNTRFRLLKNQKGMTLIELLAVVVVLGVIAAIAVPSIGATISSTKTKADTNTTDVVKEAALRYLYDKYPDGSSSVTSVKVTTDLVTNGYLASNFSAQRQVTSGGSTVYFGLVDVSYDNAKGWTVTDVTTTTATQ